MAEKKYHNSSIDTMRAFGALAIVMLHVNACWRLNLNGVEAYYGMRTGRALCEAPAPSDGVEVFQQNLVQGLPVVGPD